ncbi:TPA_asm: anti-repressor Ant [Caudoviricetes sp. vir524]|nr:TPA_asm: anti-repressor Ant [Caudoviricetes sp. vir524]
MSQALATLFEGKEIRVIEDGGEPWFPIKDLADAWGVKVNTLYQILTRQSGKFTGHVSDVHVTSTPTEDESWHKSVNERGMYLILGAINTDRLKDREVAMAILRFQRWVPELIQRYRKKEIVQVQPAVNTLDTELDRARTIAELTGTDLRTMQAAALRKCGLKEYADALTPSLMHGEAGTWLNPTQIGTRCGHTAREVNNFLEWHRFQYRGPDGLWRLTDKGELHGEEYDYPTVNKHIEIRIRWRESILTASGLVREPCETLARA